MGEEHAGGVLPWQWAAWGADTMLASVRGVNSERAQLLSTAHGDRMFLPVLYKCFSQR